MAFDIVTYAILKAYIDANSGGGTGGTTNYPDLRNKPKINSIELVGDKTSTELGFSLVSTTGDYNDLSNLPIKLTKLSELQNDMGFITNTVDNLINYYKKTEVYTKVETNDLINGISTLRVMIVDSLPTTNISTNVIYLIKVNDTSVYEQWMYIGGAWANLGSTEIDLNNYYTKTQTNNLLAGKVDKVTGKQLSDENFTSTEKAKLANLQFYTLPAATPTRLGGVMPDGVTSVTDSFGKLTIRFPTPPSEINDATTSTDKTWSSSKISTELAAINRDGATIADNVINDYQTWSSKKIDEELAKKPSIDDTTISTTKTWSSDKISKDINVVDDIAKNINYAQKTVNKRGTKQLIDNKVTFNINTATTSGAAVITLINQEVVLNSEISNYDYLNFTSGFDGVITIKSDTKIAVKDIVYNNSNTINEANGSVFSLMTSLLTSTSGAYGAFHLIARGWFKTPTVFFLHSIGNPLPTNQNWYKVFSIDLITGVDVESVTIDPVNYVNTTEGIEDSPVGSLIAMMGKTAPKHYLICDGTTYNIADYPYLAQYFKEQHGISNYFGGDGVATFAVPDSRNLFIRGYHGDKTDKLSGEIGIHQEATRIPRINPYGSGTNYVLSVDYENAGQNNSISEYDKVLSKTGRIYKDITLTPIITNNTTSIYAHTTRPENMAALYCIKYEPTYFMSIQGLMEESTLWEGSKVLLCDKDSITFTNESVTFSNNINNYDMIRIIYYWHRTSDNLSLVPSHVDLLPMEDTPIFGLQYNYTMMLRCEMNGNILKFINSISSNRGNTTGNAIKVGKVIGIKYKTS
jgi:microcystin-dependent protein